MVAPTLARRGRLRRDHALTPPRSTADGPMSCRRTRSGPRPSALRPRRARRGHAAPRPGRGSHPHRASVPRLGGRRRVQRRPRPAPLLRPAHRGRDRARRQRGRPAGRGPACSRAASTRLTCAGCRSTASAAPCATASTSPSAASACAAPSASPTAATPPRPRSRPGDVDWDDLFGGRGCRWFHTGGDLRRALASTTPRVDRGGDRRGARRTAPSSPTTSTTGRACGRRSAASSAAREVNRELVAQRRRDDRQRGGLHRLPRASRSPASTSDLTSLDTGSFEAMIDGVAAQFPNLQVVATTLRAVRTRDRQRLGRDRLVARDRLRRRDAAARPRDPRPRRRRRQLRRPASIYGLLDRGWTCSDAVEYGAAHGALAMTTPGDTSMATLAEVDARRWEPARGSALMIPSAGASSRSGARSSATCTARSRTRRHAPPSTRRGRAGIRYFDTAPHYGLGLSERRLGRALAGTPARRVRRLDEGRPAARRRWTASRGSTARASPCPATHRRVCDFSRDGIRRSLEESLERLGLDRVDIVYLHDPDDHWSEVLETGYPALAELRGEGVVRRDRRRDEPVRDAGRPRAATPTSTC